MRGLGFKVLGFKALWFRVQGLGFRAQEAAYPTFCHSTSGDSSISSEA